MDEAAWLRRRNAMGIVRWLGCDPVRLSSEGGEREGREASDHSQGIGQRLVVVGAPSREIVAMDGERHSAADRMRVRGGPPSEGEEARTS